MSALLWTIDAYQRVRMENDGSVVVIGAEGQVLGAATGPTVELALQALLSMLASSPQEVA